MDSRRTSRPLNRPTLTLYRVHRPKSGNTALESQETQTAQAADTVTKAGLAGALILGGGLRAPALSQEVGRPILDLPQNEHKSLLDNWFDAFETVGLGHETTTVLTDSIGERLWRRVPRSPALRVDSSEYRGPAGVLRDASDSIKDDGARLVIEHTRLLGEAGELRSVYESHLSGDQSITIATNPDGSFAGILIADPDAIQIIPTIGFMDIKEQWIPAVQANGFSVRRVPLGCRCEAIRSLDTYLGVLDRLDAFSEQPFSHVLGRIERGITQAEYGGSLIMPTAQIGSGVSAARSVICDCAEIGDGAIVVRSVVGPHARVPKEGVVVDSVVRATDD